ncbi:MAG: glycosyltransferase [Marmoricola sp.]
MKKRVVVVAPPGCVFRSAPRRWRLSQGVGRCARAASEVTFLCPTTVSNVKAANQPGAPHDIRMLGLEKRTNLLGKAMNRASLWLDRRWRYLDPGMPSVPFLLGLRRDPEAVRRIRDADLIDLQWSDSIRLVRRLRKLNPRARIVGTFHDVLSQSLSREPRVTVKHKLYWGFVAARSRRHERAMVRALDEVIVFSSKDAHLLGDPHHCRIVLPPLAAGVTASRHSPAKDPIVVVVSYLARDENDKAAVWVVEHLWPLVKRQVTTAQLRLVGVAAKPGLESMVAQDESIALTGFVESLEPEYAAASVALVPLSQGAGLKFKTVEALLYGVPLVTTPVGGAEGVGGAQFYDVVPDRADELAAAVIAVLKDARSFQPRADQGQNWAQETYGQDQFEDHISEILSLS